MFEIINEVAVAGCTFLMMAIGTVWYSSMFFGRFWDRQILAQPKAGDIGAPSRLAGLFLSYFVMLFLLAHAVVFAPLLSLSVFAASLCITAFVLALRAASAFTERRTLAYFLIDAGFYAVFIIGGMLVLHFWPW